MVLELEVKKVPLNIIKFDETNPNELSKDQMEALKLTMEKYGYLAPVILNKDFTIVDGEHRVRIYQELGKQEIQAYVIDVDQIDLKILRQLMNKLRGEHDKQKDANEFKSIFDAGKLDEFSKLLAKPKEEFESILEKKFNIDFVKEEDPIPEIPRETKVKLGDIYQLGNHRVMCGDCTIKENVDKLLEGKTVDLLLTDPPYGVDYSSKNRFLDSIGRSNSVKEAILNDTISDYSSFFESFLKIIPFSDYNISYVFQLGIHTHTFRISAEKAGLTWSDWLVWVKNNHVLGRKDYNAKHEWIFYGWKNHHKFYAESHRTTVLEYDKPHINNLHPTMKPIELITGLIKDGSKQEMLVYDCFLGSGSTLIACESTNRVCYGMELDPFYIDVIIQRWENYTGKKAQKITS